MSFVKTGQAMPFKVASAVCELCGQAKAEFLIDGKMICASCKAKADAKIETPIAAAK